MHVHTHAHTHAHAHAHTPHVLVDAHTLAHMLACMGHFQEMSADQGIKLKNCFGGYKIFIV